MLQCQGQRSFWFGAVEIISTIGIYACILSEESGRMGVCIDLKHV